MQDMKKYGGNCEGVWMNKGGWGERGGGRQRRMCNSDEGGGIRQGVVISGMVRLSPAQ